MLFNFNCFFVYLDIEDLTRKTGNFKQFPIFCSMLESAVRKVCVRGGGEVRGRTNVNTVNR